MSLPRISLQAAPGERPVLTVDGSPLPGVRSAQVTVTADGVPQVSLILAASAVDLELPAGVNVITTGPTATEFAEQLSPARLEGLALQQLELDDLTQGEAFARAAQLMAAEYDQAHRD